MRYTASAVYDRMDLYLDLTQTKNTANNTSTISYSLYFYVKATGGYNFSNGNSLTLTLNGTTYVSTPNIKAININGLPVGSTVALASGSFTVAHNSDGTKSIGVYAHFLQTGNTQGDWTINTSWTLESIGRATTPTLSASSVNVGSSLIISTSGRASTSFTHDLSWKVGNGSYTSIATGVNTSYTWTLPSSIADAITNASSGTVTIRCVTKNGSTTIGEKTVTFTANIPNTSEFNPTVSITLSDESGIPSTYGWLQNLSRCKAVAAGTGKHGAAISQYAIKIGSADTVNASTAVATLVSSGTVTVTATVTDSRGKTATATQTISVTPFSIPDLSANVYRCTQSGALDESGEYIRIALKVTFTSLSGRNSLTTKWEYRAADSQTFIQGGSWTGAKDTYIIAPMSSDDTYVIRITTQDNFTTLYRDYVVSSATVPLDLLAGGKGVAIGKVADLEGVCDIAWPINDRKGFYKTPITSATDFDDLTDIGRYAIESVSGMTNCPSLYPGELIIRETMAASDDFFDYREQWYHDTNGDAYERTFVVWDGDVMTMGNWQKVSFLKYEDHPFTLSSGISAGTPGTRGGQVTYTPDQTPISSSIISVYDSSEYNPVTFIQNGTVYLNYYRATTGSVSSSRTAVTVRIFY